MNTIQRYNYQKESDPIQRHIDNIKRAINHFGNQLIDSKNSTAIDSYIIKMVMTRDGRRALIDINKINSVKEAIEKDVVYKVSADINKMINQINKII